VNTRRVDTQTLRGFTPEQARALWEAHFWDDATFKDWLMVRSEVSGEKADELMAFGGVPVTSSESLPPQVYIVRGASHVPVCDRCGWIGKDRWTEREARKLALAHECPR
jgi:hypothetical protein